MKRVCQLLVIAALCLPILPNTAFAISSSITWKVPDNGTNCLSQSSSQTQTCTTDIPNNALDVDTNSLTFTGSNVTISNVQKNMSTHKLSFTITGEASVRSSVRVYGYSNDHKVLFETKPGDILWRDSSGTQWQMNNWDRVNGYTKPIYDYGSDYPGKYPTDKPPVYSMSTFSKPLPVSNISWFYADGTPLEPIYTVNQGSTVLSDRDGTVLGQPNDLQMDPYGNNLTRHDDYTLYVDFAEPDDKQWEDPPGGSTPPAWAGYGVNVQGRVYYSSIYFAVMSYTNSITTYKFNGSVTYNYTPSGDWSLGASAIANPMTKVFDGQDTTVSVTTIGTISNLQDPGAIDHWEYWQRKEQDTDPSLVKHNTVNPNGTLTQQDGNNFVIPASDVGSSDFAQNFKTHVFVYFKGNCIGQQCKFDSVQKLNYMDAVADASTIITQQPVTPTAPPTPPGPPLGKPKACISNSPEVRAGDYLFISGGCSSSPNGDIKTWYWATQGATGYIPSDKPNGQVMYLNEGTYPIGLQIVDVVGAYDDATSAVKVTPPYPVACFNITGNLKQNRKASVDGSCSNSPTLWPINSYSWSITAISGGTSSDIKPGTSGNSTTMDLVFKKPGTYQISLTVTNTKNLSDTRTQQITITPDLSPVADFDTIHRILRDPTTGNGSIQIWDRSYSPDGDPIVHREWYIMYDTNNNGSFADETPILINSGNSTYVEYTTNQVGTYRIMLSVTETFGQPTIPAFITTSDYQTDNTWQ
jgi:hypothetical protein